MKTALGCFALLSALGACSSGELDTAGHHVRDSGKRDGSNPDYKTENTGDPGLNPFDPNFPLPSFTDGAEKVAERIRTEGYRCHSDEQGSLSIKPLGNGVVQLALVDRAHRDNPVTISFEASVKLNDTGTMFPRMQPVSIRVGSDTRTEAATFEFFQGGITDIEVTYSEDSFPRRLSFSPSQPSDQCSFGE